MTASLHKLTAGDGYTYLTRQVAVTDSTERGRSNLADYYSDKGERPGRWFGSGVAGLGSVAIGDQVTEAHMRALFGEGRHPDADRIQHDVIAGGGSVQEALKASKLGRAYPIGNGKPTPFLIETQRRYQQYNAERGLRLNAAVPDSVRSEIRTEVGRSTFADAYGRPPADQQELTSHITRQSRRPEQAVAGFDVTFTPVKSVSALWAVAPIEVAGEIEAAHEAAVEHALGWLEAEVAHTRRGAQGQRQTEVAGILAAVFTHRDSRNGDPNLHTHVAVANKVQDRADGAWLSLDGAALYRAMVTVSEHYNSHLEAQVIERLGVEFEAKPSRSGRRPIRELVGVPTQILDAWSSRRAQIEAEQDRLAGEFQSRLGRAPTAVEMIQLAQQANLATRRAKHEPRSLAEQRASWRNEAAAVLGSQDAVDAVTGATAGRRNRDPAVGEHGGVVVDDALLARVAARAVATLERARARWQPTHVMAEAYRLLREYDLPTETIDPAVQAVLERVVSEAVPLTRPDQMAVPAALRRGDGTSMYEPKHTRLYTTQRILDAEERIVDLAGLTDGRIIPNRVLNMALLEAEANGRSLNNGQVELVKTLGQSGRRVQLALAPAGSGKTTAMETLARAWTESGGTVVGLAPSAVAADELRAAVPDGVVDTLARLAYALQPMDDGELLPLPGWADRIDENTLVLVDEAGMAGTTDLATVVDFVVGRGGSVRLIGDDRQLAAVGAGGVLRDVQEVAGAATLTELMRFTDASEAAATLALRDGDPAAAGFYLDRGRLHDTGDPIEVIVDAWAGDVDQGRSASMIVGTLAAATELNERARSRRIAQGLVDGAGAQVMLRSGLPASVGDEILTRNNDRNNRFGPTDFVKNGDRWTVTKIGDDRAVKVRHQRSGMVTWLSADYTAAHVDHAYAVTVYSAQGSTVDVSHVLVDGTENRQALYVALSRGRSANHLYLRSGGDGDPHNTIKPEVVRPSTGAEILAGILERDGTEQSASTSRRLTASPQLLLRQHALRYLDGVFAAAEDVAGPAQLRAIEEGAEQIQPGVTSCGGWPLLRMMLAVIHVAGDDPIERLREARDKRPLGDARDVAAVLTWRLDDTNLFGGAGPLPWLRAVPEPLQTHPAWGPYLAGRAELVDHYATEVRDQAALVTELSRWAEPISHDARLWRDLAVWRAANNIPDTDPLPAGAKLPPSRERNHQQKLEDRIAKVVDPPKALPAAAMRLLHEQEPRVADDPFWPVIARRLAAADWGSQDPAGIMAAALAAGPLPEEMPAAALWFRLAGQLHLTEAEVAPDIRLRPDWTADLLRRLPDRIGQRLLVSPDWPELVAVVTDRTAATGLPAVILLDRALAGLNTADPVNGGPPADAVPAMLIARLSEHIAEPPHGDGDHDLPPDPADIDAARPEDVDDLHSATHQPSVPDLSDLTHPDSADTDPTNVEPTEVEQDEAAGGEQLATTAPARLIELNEAAAAWWAQQYLDSSAARYVRGRLGDDLADDPRVTVGYAPAGWTNLADHLRHTHQVDDQELVDAGLAKWSKRGTLIDLMRDRVVFGIRDSDGQLVGFTGRAAPGADPKAPKWLNTPTTPIFTKGRLLFGLAENQDRLAAGATPVRVEGVFDALAVTLAGDGQAVGLAPLGTALTAAQADLLAKATRDQVVVYGTDTDTAGTKAAHRDHTMLAARGVDVRRLILTDGQRTFHDPADAFATDRGAALRTVLAAVDVAPPLAAHLIADLITRDQHSDHIMATVALARQIGPVIAAAPPEDWNDLIEGATTMIGEAHNDRDNLDRYREPILAATIDAVDSWQPLRRALKEAPAPPPAAEPNVSYADQTRDRLNHIATTLAGMRQRSRSDPTTEPTAAAVAQHRREEERLRHADQDRPGQAR